METIKKQKKELSNTSYKCQLVPTQEQIIMFYKTISNCKVASNYALGQFRQGNFKFSTKEMGKKLPFLKETSSNAAARAINDIKQAITNHKKNPGHFKNPDFKKLKEYKKSFAFQNPIFRKQINSNKGVVNIPCVGDVIFLKQRKRNLPDEVFKATVSYRGCKWWISFSYHEDFVKEETGNKSVGVDRGITKSYQLSDGKCYNTPVERIKKLERRLKRYQRSLARKYEAHKKNNRTHKSNNYFKAKEKVNKTYNHIANVRDNFLHNTTKEISNNYDIVVLEDLNVKKMSKSNSGTIENPGKEVAKKSKLNKSILDQGWTSFETQLTYKLKRRKNGKVVKVNPAYTSQTCSKCGTVSKENRKTQAKFKCINCEHEENADLNAAKNIHNKFLNKTTEVILGSYMPVEELITPMKQEAANEEKTPLVNNSQNYIKGVT